MTRPILPQSYPTAERASARLAEYAKLACSAAARGDLHGLKAARSRCLLQLAGIEHAIELAESETVRPCA